MYDRMTIKEIAQLCHTSTRTLRYYEEIGLIKPSRMENNYRTYSFDALSRVEVILMLKKTGMRLDQIKKELSRHRRVEDLLETQKRLLEEEKQRISSALAFIDAQQRMAALFKEYGLNKLFINPYCCERCEKVRRVEGDEKLVLMEYDELHMAIEMKDDPAVYIVKKCPPDTGRPVAAVFLSEEHRIRRRQKVFARLMQEQGYECTSLIYSESCCLLGEQSIYFMWCEIGKYQPG